MSMTAADNNDLDNACRKVAAAAIKGGWQVALAESCTGGLTAERLTAIPGASKWFSFGVVSYANAAKTAILAVPPQVIKQHGAVSEQTAAAMCNGATAIFANNKNARAGNDKTGEGNNAANDSADNDESGSIKIITIAITGIAGPGGDDNEQKPIGTICFGWQTTIHNTSQKTITQTKTKTKTFPGTRHQTRQQSATYALQQAAIMMSG